MPLVLQDVCICCDATSRSLLRIFKSTMYLLFNKLITLGDSFGWLGDQLNNMISQVLPT